MYDYGTFSFESKAQVLEQAKKYWNPDKTQFWTDAGVDLVIDRREGYFLWDMSGKRLIDMHLNGGTYNLGHRNPEVMQALIDGMQYFDIGNHHFPSVARTALAQRLVDSAPASITKVAFGSGGGEAIDIALKSARHATQRRKIVSIIKAYHGHTGLAVATGDDRFSKLFLSDRPDEFVQVPFGDVDAMDAGAVRRRRRGRHHGDHPRHVRIPACPQRVTSKPVKELCVRYDALYIADEVQTGLMRTGEMWGITKHGIEPDIMVAGKGLSGGMYPITAAMLGDRAAQWLDQDGFAPHLDLRRCRTRLRRRHQDAGDHQPPRGAGVGARDRRRLRRGAGPHPGRLPGLVRRHPAERRGDRPGVRPSRRRQVRDARALRERRVGDLLDAGSPCAAVQTGPAAEPRAVRRRAGPLGRGGGQGARHWRRRGRRAMRGRS